MSSSCCAGIVAAHAANSETEKGENHMKRVINILAVSAAVSAAQTATAQTEIEFWHAFTGRLGDLVAE